ncbi:MAG TPA: hypothetical protein VET88_10965 [Gammaproteobacteria bacterium]|nr:hypothetical protein [Gammaproteobacteria bacterium]
MMLTESCIHLRARELRRAQSDTRMAYAHLRRSIRVTAASPVGISAGFLAGLGAARLLCCRPAGTRDGRSRLRMLRFLLPLWHLL